MINIKKKYIAYVTCNICGKSMNTGMCYTRFEIWLKSKIIKRKHWHTRAEIVSKKMFGLYISTTNKKGEKIYEINKRQAKNKDI